MIGNLEEFLTGVAVGVRFRANFSIEDQIGKIADTLLYSKNSYFSPNVFPQVQNMVGSKQLLNTKTMDRLQVDNSNVILDFNFLKDSFFQRKNTATTLKEFDRQVIKGVMVDFKIKEIVRIGIIQRYIFTIEDLARTFVDKTIGKTLDGVNDINLSFSKRVPVGESLVKRGVNDYDNVIFNIIKKADLKEIFMAIDYQSYFDPFLPHPGEIEFDKFLQRANDFNNGKYLNWLNTNYIEA